VRTAEGLEAGEAEQEGVTFKKVREGDLAWKTSTSSARDRASSACPPHNERALRLRAHLKIAKVDRDALHTDNLRQKQLTLHDLRGTGITWAAARGDNPLRIKQRAGHSGFVTTEGYIREAENLTEGFGEPFPRYRQN
jgi:integrase